MILVRNHIVDMLGVEIGKTASRRIKNQLWASSNKNSSLCTIHWYIWGGADLKTVVKFMTVFVTRRDSPIPS
jgi:hypothetical protein